MTLQLWKLRLREVLEAVRSHMALSSAASRWRGLAGRGGPTPPVPKVPGYKRLAMCFCFKSLLSPVRVYQAP